MITSAQVERWRDALLGRDLTRRGKALREMGIHKALPDDGLDLLEQEARSGPPLGDEALQLLLDRDPKRAADVVLTRLRNGSEERQLQALRLFPRLPLEEQKALFEPLMEIASGPGRGSSTLLSRIAVAISDAHGRAAPGLIVKSSIGGPPVRQEAAVKLVSETCDIFPEESGAALQLVVESTDCQERIRKAAQRVLEREARLRQRTTPTEH